MLITSPKSNKAISRKPLPWHTKKVAFARNCETRYAIFLIGTLHFENILQHSWSVIIKAHLHFGIHFWYISQFTLLDWYLQQACICVAELWSWHDWGTLPAICHCHACVSTACLTYSTLNTSTLLMVSAAPFVHAAWVNLYREFSRCRLW